MNQIDEIRQEMARIRHDLHEDVAGVVEGANDAMDWRSYPRNHPWISAGVAALVGYLLVPKRSRPTEVVTVVTPPPLPKGAMAYTAPQPQQKPRSLFSPWRILGWAISFAGPLALNAAQAYASVWLENQLGLNPKGSRKGTAPDGPEGRAARSPMEGQGQGRGGFSPTTFGSGRGPL